MPERLDENSGEVTVAEVTVKRGVGLLAPVSRGSSLAVELFGA